MTSILIDDRRATTSDREILGRKPGDVRHGDGAVPGERHRKCVEAELRQVETLAEQGLVELEPGAIQVMPIGWYFVRAVAMVFDRHVQADRVRECFSRII